MSGVIKSVFGGSTEKAQRQDQSTQESGNHAFDFISQALSPLLQAGPAAGNALAGLLGLQGDSGQATAFDNYKNSTGYNFTKDQGIQGIGQGTAGIGAYNSGATGKALSKYTTGLANNTFNSYLQALMGLGNAGLGAAGALSDAGKYSYGQSTGSSTSSSSSYSGGLGKALGFGGD